VDDASQQAASSRVSRNDYTDKITNIGVPLTQPDPPTRNTPAPARQPVALPRTDVFDGVRDPRTAVRDAQRKRQEQLDANRQRFGADESGRDAPATRPTPPLPPLSAGDDEQLPIVRVPRTDRTRRDISIPIPPAPIDGLPVSRQSQSPELARQPAPGEPPRSSAPESPPASRAMTKRSQPRPQPQPQPLPPPSNATEQLPIAEVRASLDSGAAERGPTPPPTKRRAPTHVDQPVSDHAERRPLAAERERPVARRLPDANIEHWTGLDASHYIVTAPRVEIPTALAVDPVDSSERLRTVRRCCGTCRDYRRDGDGERGWCENPHAFAQRRMVQSSELACRSSIGVWWLPHDELWLERADITHHGRPTPLMDVLGRELMLNKQAMDTREPELEIE
jgi:hypothetical protein